MRRVFIYGICLFMASNCALLRRAPKPYEPPMVFVKGGSFILGDFYAESNTDALPLHEVFVEDFYIGRYEVTFAEYDMFAEATGRELLDAGRYGRGQRAVVNVTFDDALAFCKSMGYRLPSEIEWEYAARSRGKNHVYSGTTDIDSLWAVAITRGSDINHSIQVGTKLPNELGLYDMSGNVFEWIDEYYQFYHDPELFHDNENDGIRIIRGGSFAEREATNRTYWRVGTLKSVTATDLGFRCVKDG